MRERLKKSKQRGFSLLELMVALTIIGIIAVVASKTIGRQSDEAKRMQAYDVLQQVSLGLGEYYLKNGGYPELGSWDAIVGSSSPLKARDMIRPNLPLNDPWGSPYEGKSTKLTFELKCAGRPDLGEDLGPMSITQNGPTGAPGMTNQNNQNNTQTTATSEATPQ